MRSFRSFLLLIVLGAILSGCRRDPLPGDEAWAGGTPLRLDIPAWAMTSAHGPILPFDNPLTVEGVDLGRRLFYEKALSNDFSISCGSCHLQEHAFSDPRPVSIGTDGSPGRRNSMPVMNMVFDHFFFWDSRALTLELQAFKPVVDHAEMRNTWPVVVSRLQSHPEYPGLFRKAFGTDRIDSTLVAFAIAQFERTLLSFGSRFDRYHFGGDSLALTEQEKRGFNLFMNDAFCGGCHMLPMFTDHSVRNNGLDMVFTDLGLGEVSGVREHEGRFKTPSLRNVAVTAPYMHDSRFSTLEEVMDFYAEGVQTGSPNLDIHMQPWLFGNIELSPTDRADIIAFMRTLTDERFLTDPRFSDPN